MKKRMVLLIMVLCSSFLMNNVSAADKDGLKGIWEYEAPSVSYEYSNGQLIFGEADGELTVSVKFIDGTEIPCEQISFINDSLSFGINMDEGFVKVTCKVEGDKLNGKVDTPQGQVDISAKKQK